MHILFITDDLYPSPGGIAVFSEHVIQALKKAGHSVTTFGPKGSPTSDFYLPTSEFAKLITKDDHLGCFPSMKLLKLIFSGTVDVIHINCPQGFTSLPVCLIARMKNIKVVFFNHGNVVTYCKDNIKNRFLGSLAAKLVGIMYYLPQLLCKAVIVQNPGCSDLQILFSKKIKKLNVRDGRCGIDLDSFRFSSRFEPFSLVSVGRLSAEKNWKRLLQLFLALPKYYKLTIIGSGAQEKELKNFCAENGLDNVIFVGRIPHQEIAAYLQRAQAYISASLFETWGLTLTESLACGTPIIYPDHSPFTQLYSEQFPKGRYQIDQVETFVKAVLKTEVLTVEDRHDCHLFAQQFSWEHATKNLIDIYSDRDSEPLFELQQKTRG